MGLVVTICWLSERPEDRERLAACRAEQPLIKRTVVTWRKSVSGQCGALDIVVGAYLTQLNGTAPW
ncbi:MAG: hypothetical protein ACT4QG_12580 [Sporichthyaceae bacterium]